MENAGYTTLNRQVGLLREMTAVAQNIANMSTTGYRREGLIFSEFVRDLGPDAPSLSMATGRVREMDLTHGAMTKTGAEFDLAIEGDGFFLIQTPGGDQLTRAGSFTRDAAGTLVTPDGYPLLDAGGAPVFAPPEARTIAIAPDGTLSADGNPLAQIGLWRPEDTNEMSRATGVRFAVDGALEPLEDGVILQGYLEGSNVNPVTEITRMIEVQRAYELGQGFMEREDERIRSTLRTLGQ